jgi:hypothetical protein
MASYGRNFDFRVTPMEYMRRGRFFLDQGADIPIGVPVATADAAPPSLGYTEALPAKLATGAQAPRKALCGLAVYEWIDFNGLDPQIYGYSDRDTIPNGKLIQVISGVGVKVVFKNTADHTFMSQRSYKGRMMVAGMGATPTVKVGDHLSPGTGTDAAGYWAVNATATNAWLRVSHVDAQRQEVEAEFVF